MTVSSPRSSSCRWATTSTPHAGVHLISSRDVWVEANFKEDELTYMRPGQRRGHASTPIRGAASAHRVVSLSPGTGAQFSLLPPENATGNWVKVVQRVPVRLQFDRALDVSEVPLHAGLSADVTVDTGHRRRLFGHAQAQRRQRCHECGERQLRAPAPAPLHRGMITATVMLASILQALDNTIANVALPRMQGSLSATQDQMTWVLTSYIVAAAIMTPLTGWLADRFGRKRLFLISIIGFTIASALCGLAQSLDQIVLFRLLQG
jgi:hypothetical protein